MNAVMMLHKAASFSAVVRSFFPSPLWQMGHCSTRIFSGCHAGHDVRKPIETKPKAKNTPAHQGKFPLTPLSSSASACAAHPVKGRCALRSVSLHFAPDLLARLQPSLLTTAAPREIFPQGRRSQKAASTIPAFLISASDFPGNSFPRGSGRAAAFRVSIVRFPLVRMVFSGCDTSAFPMRAISLPSSSYLCSLSAHPSFPGSSFGGASGGGFWVPGQHRALSVGAHSVFRQPHPCFPPVRRAFSGCGAFAFRKHFSRFLHACSFVRHHPGGPAYVSYRRCASYFTAGEWLRPFEPRKKEQRQEKA